MALITTPDQVANVFPDHFFSVLDHALQQKDSRLGGRVTQSGRFVGEDAFFPQMDAVVAEDLVRLEELSLKNGAHKMLKVTCSPRVCAMPVADVDKSKLNISLASEYAMATDMAIKRDLDAIIYAAMRTEANRAGTEIATIGNYNDNLDFGLMLQAVGLLDENEAMQDQELTFVMPALPRARLAGDLNLSMARADQSGVGNATLKFLNPLDDVAFVTFGGCSNITSATPALNAGVVGTDVFLFAKSAVCAAYNDQPNKINERVGQRMLDAIGVWHQAGAMVRYPKGIVRIKCRRNPPIAITPLSTKEAA